jgi:hypothetical protein
MTLHAGVGRTRLTPPWGVDLSGWGYYLERKWLRIRDHTAATALVLADDRQAIAVIAVDLMYADADFTRVVRDHVARHTLNTAGAVCVACSHSHNTPTAAFVRGVGEVDADYIAWAARQAATAAILAWQQRRPGRLAVGSTQLNGWTYNRTREAGPVDTTLGVWRVEDEAGKPIAAVVNFQGHPTVQMSLGPADLSRDLPGQVTDLIEAAVPGVTALYLQGSCGDVNFDHAYHTPARCQEPGRAVAAAALATFARARPIETPVVRSHVRKVTLPTRRWQREEVTAIKEEAEHRLRTGDTSGWLDGFARVVVNAPARLPERYGGSVEKAIQAVSRFGLEWARSALADLDTRPEVINTEVQAIRVGDAYLAANGSELFSSLALDLRRQWGGELLLVGYANGGIGYMPDAYDIERRSYAADQSPRFTGQFPFTAESGPALVQGMLEALIATGDRP